MRIKTREALKTIKTFDRADTIAQKSRNGVSSLHDSAEQMQSMGYESETDYAGSALQSKEGYIARTSIMGADCIGRWGIKETRKNICKWKNRPKKTNPNPKLKQLPAPKKQALPAGKKVIKMASKGTKTAAKTTFKGTKATVKTSVKAAQFMKKATTATVKLAKVAGKAIIAAVKATAAVVKGIVAAIVAGGWISVLIIIIVVIVSLVFGSIYGIFIPNEDDGIAIFSVKSDLEREYHQRQSELIANCRYDILNYEGDIADWREMIAVYAVKINLGDEPQEVVTFDENKAATLKEIFWDMNEISLRTETRTTAVTKYITDDEGKPVEIREDVTTIILTVVTDCLSIDEISAKYGFSAKQKEMLSELLREENAELWAEILGE